MDNLARDALAAVLDSAANALASGLPPQDELRVLSEALDALRVYESMFVAGGERR